MTSPATPEGMKETVLRILGDIAPEVDVTTIKPEVNFRDQVDIDSMDFLNFVIALHEQFHVEIPEADYPKLTTLNGCVTYLTAAQGIQ